MPTPLHEYNLDSSADLINFQRAVVCYCNDNDRFIRAYENEGGDYAEWALLHHNYNAEMGERTVMMPNGMLAEQKALTGEHADEFKSVARRLRSDGFVPHAGNYLHD